MNATPKPRNPETQKNQRVSKIFQDAAPKYDLMNDLSSLGLHRIWKKILINALHIPKNAKDLQILDAATGSGDIGFGILKKTGKNTKTLMMDSEPQMLKLAIAKNPFGNRALFILSDARHIPLREKSVHGFTIGFGIRNIHPPEKTLQEAFRILRTGGRFLCLELSRPKHPWIQPLYDLYAHQHLPRLGKLILGKAEPYRYLAESVRAFPPAETIARLMEETGFSRVKFTPLSGGIATLYAAWRL